ncbi:unnamed protein product, partial [Rotaria sordida]
QYLFKPIKLMIKINENGNRQCFSLHKEMNKLNKNHPRENSFMKFELRHNQTFTICLHDQIIRSDHRVHIII